MYVTEVKKFSTLGAEKLGEMAKNPVVYTDFLKFQGEICILCNQYRTLKFALTMPI